MIYHVRAKFRDDTAASLLLKISNGTIARQQPDGPELIASLERAVLNAAGEVEWSEMCFCPSPLHHERITLLDAHFENIITEPINAHTPRDLWRHVQVSIKKSRIELITSWSK